MIKNKLIIYLLLDIQVGNDRLTKNKKNSILHTIVQLEKVWT